MQKSSAARAPKSCTDPVQLSAIEGQKNRGKARDDYEQTTSNQKFSKDFNSSLEAIMHDPMATWSERFTAWLKRYSWGEYALYAIRQDGEPRTLADAAREIAGPEEKLESIKACLSHTAKYMETKNYLHRDGKKLYPVIAPSAAPPSKKVVEAATFSEFLEHWKVAKAATFSELETAESIIKAIKKSRLGDYKKWKRLQLSEPVSLLPENRERKTTHTHEASVTTVACARDDSTELRVHEAHPSAPEDEHTPLLVVAPAPVREEPPPAPRPGPLPLTPPLRPPRQPLNPPPASPPPRPTPPPKEANAELRERFIRDYPDQSDKTALGKAYDRHVKPDMQLACDACLTRFLKSDRVSRNVVDAGSRWLARQAANGFSGDWAPPPKPASRAKPTFVDNVTRLIGENLAKGKPPW